MAKRKNRKNEIRNMFPENTTVSITRYTFDAWMRCYPESNELEWAYRTYPESLIEFVNEFCIELEDAGIPLENINQINVVTIDDEYFDWLKEKSLSDTEQNRSDYAIEKRDEAFRLLKKNDGERTWLLTALPVFCALTEEHVINEQTFFTLKKEEVKGVKEYIQKCIPDADIYVGDFLMSGGTYLNNTDKVLSLARTFIKDGQNVNLREFDTQSYSKDDCNLVLLYIPIVISEVLETATFSPDELLSDGEIPKPHRCPEFIAFEREVLDCYGLTDIPSISQTDFFESFTERYPFTDILPQLIYVEEIPKEEAHFRSEIRKAVKEEKRKKRWQKD